MKPSITDLKNKGFVNFTYPIELRQAVHRATSTWKQFCLLSIETKKGLPYSSNADGVGYEFKQGGGKAADHKENFDVTIEGKHWLQNNQSFINHSVIRDFLEASTNLVGIMKPLVLEFARQAEQAFNLEGFLKEVSESEDTFFVRFIHYFGNVLPGEEIATTHPDRSGFTLHLFESDPGLQCYSFDGKWMEMPVGEGDTVIIPSMQLQLRSKGVLKALNHRVIATEHTARNGRFSAVCFVQLKHTAKCNKNKVGRMQEVIQDKGVGFNYNLTILNLKCSLKIKYRCQNSSQYPYDCCFSCILF